MKQAAAYLAIGLALSASAGHAQDAPVYGPCLERYADLDAYIAAFEAEGWRHRTWARGRNRAAPPLAEIHGLIATSPNSFRSADAAAQYAAMALDRYQSNMEFLDFLTRGDLSLALAVGPVSTGVFIVRCDFAGPSIPGFEATFGENLRTPEGLAFSVGSLEIDRPEGVVDVSIFASRVEGDDTILAPITGREGITINVDFELNE